MHQLGSRHGGELTGVMSQPRNPAHSPCPRRGGRSRPWASPVHVPCPLPSCSLARPEGPGEDGCGCSQTGRAPPSRTVGKPREVLIFRRKTHQASARLGLSALPLIFLSDKGSHTSGSYPLALSSSVLFARFPQLCGKCSFPGGSDGKASACGAGDLGSIPGSGRFPWRKAWQPTPVFSPGESHGGLQSTGSQRAGHDGATKHSTQFIFYLEKP